MSAEQNSKSEWRQIARKRRADISAKDRALLAQRAAAKFIEYIAVEPQQIIAVYWPIGDEIDPGGVIAPLRQMRCQVCLPVIAADGSTMLFRLWPERSELQPAGFGTMGPGPEAEIVEPDLIVAPLLGFDDKGTRLGYGKGHYDQAIAQMSKIPFLVGMAFSAQKLDNIPAEDHDLPLDAIVTEIGVRGFDDTENLDDKDSLV